MDISISSNGFFGKLPGFADFIKYNAAGREILSIDSWLQEGISLAILKYNDEWKNYYNSTAYINFIYPYTGTENIIIGVISPGSDKSGRTFPFILFCNIRRSIINDIPFYLVPLLYKDIFASFNEIIELNKSTENISNLKSLTDSIKPGSLNKNLISDYKRVLSENTLNDIDNVGECHFNLNNYFDERLRIFQNLVCMKFEIKSEQSDESFFISYNTQLLKRIFKNSEAAPGIFWKKADDNSIFLYLLFSKPKPKDFIDILFYDKLSTVQNSDNNYTSAKSVFRDNSTVDSSTNLNSFLDDITKYLN